MKRLKIAIPNSERLYRGFEWLLGAIEWAYGDTYFTIGTDVVKLVEIKFRDGVNPEEILERLKSLPQTKDVKAFPRNEHYLIYLRASFGPQKEKAERLFELQKKGLVVFESGTFVGGESILSVLCEDGLVGEVVRTFRETYGARVISVEDAESEKSPISKLTKRQAEVLLLAYKSGYFDEPRKVTLRELAEMLNLSPSTVKEHLRKGLKKVLEGIIE
ncbi:helix-turn-helix domain-containing protein [Thermococcus aciditolerans]|uniref:Winged helix-turn-helix transcriptional regulator n=1 Tax=Thermococcus aciditolerans TaxID=2598455 RepID=A0A5C0SLV2_9EURY|nr:helix-turn-helix domain-containing protein [Thermococcus aciditolerans]QEK14148.1 winged helix-turn-helix transcriptional regulator [Thermococcus aciditolerans]